MSVKREGVPDPPDLAPLLQFAGSAYYYPDGFPAHHPAALHGHQSQQAPPQGGPPQSAPLRPAPPLPVNPPHAPQPVSLIGSDAAAAPHQPPMPPGHYRDTVKFKRTQVTEHSRDSVSYRGPAHGFHWMLHHLYDEEDDEGAST